MARSDRHKPPAFQMYAQSWLASTRGMPHDVKGAYIDLLCWAWDNGPLPNSPAWRARVFGTNAKETARLWAALRHKFVRIAQGWINARLEEQRGELAAYQARAKNAADARWHGSDSHQASVEHASSTCSNDAKPMPASIAQASREHMLNGSTVPVPLSLSVDRTHRRRTPPVNRRAPFKVYAAIATQVLTDTPTDDHGEHADRFKWACAEQGLPYDIEIAGRALRAAERGQRRKAEERG